MRLSKYWSILTLQDFVRILLIFYCFLWPHFIWYFTLDFVYNFGFFRPHIQIKPWTIILSIKQLHSGHFTFSDIVKGLYFKKNLRSFYCMPFDTPSDGHGFFRLDFFDATLRHMHQTCFSKKIKREKAFSCLQVHCPRNAAVDRFHRLAHL